MEKIRDVVISRKKVGEHFFELFVDYGKGFESVKPKDSSIVLLESDIKRLASTNPTGFLLRFYEKHHSKKPSEFEYNFGLADISNQQISQSTMFSGISTQPQSIPQFSIVDYMQLQFDLRIANMELSREMKEKAELLQFKERAKIAFAKLKKENEELLDRVQDLSEEFEKEKEKKSYEGQIKKGAEHLGAALLAGAEKKFLSGKGLAQLAGLGDGTNPLLQTMMEILKTKEQAQIVMWYQILLKTEQDADLLAAMLTFANDPWTEDGEDEESEEGETKTVQLHPKLEKLNELGSLLSEEDIKKLIYMVRHRPDYFSLFQNASIEIEEDAA